MTSSISVCIRRKRRISPKKLKECSRLIYEAEEKMEIMNRTLEA